MTQAITHPPVSELAVWTIPNAITVSRLVLSFVVFALIAAGDLWVTSAALFVVAVSTDYLDGYLARRWNQRTVLGRILDPFVDKIIICGAFLFLQNETRSLVGPWFNVVLISREMFITSLRGFLEQRGIDFKAEWSGKVKMTLQSVAVPVCLLACDEGLSGQPWLVGSQIGLLWGVLVVTVYSGVEYVVRAVVALRVRPREDSWTPITDIEFQKLLEEQIAELTVIERDVFDRLSVGIQVGAVRRSDIDGVEKVNIVLRCGDHVLYYDDVEDGFNFSPADENNIILQPYYSQDRLAEAMRLHVMSWWRESIGL